MSNIKEVKGDLFKCPETTSLAHCVSEDLRMGAGIAVIFKNKFGGVNELKQQGATVGDVAVLSREGRFVYYLVSKTVYRDKPTYVSLESCIRMMKDHCDAHGVKELAMPKIGCGLDRLEWPKVKEILVAVFKDSDINVTVYSL